MRSLLLYILAFISVTFASVGFISCSIGTKAISSNKDVNRSSFEDSIRLNQTDKVINIDSIPPLSDSVIENLAKNVSAAIGIDDTASPEKIDDFEPIVASDSNTVDSMEMRVKAKLDSIRSAKESQPVSRIVRQKVDLDAQVVFSAKDSVILVRQDSAFMYGESTLSYGDDLKLDASNIEMDLPSNTVFAVGATDSLGVVTGNPVFNEGGTDYEAKTMEYNFKTRKGYISNVITQQGEGYLTGGTTKKDVDNNYYTKDGRYTTCDNHECPHFYFNITKLKLRPGKDIVLGPAYMVLAGLPLPIAVPFGFFPFTDSYASGVIVPTFGDDYQRGFYLSNGGYYFAISENMDLALTGELYTKGSWGLSAQSNYVKRYKFNGSFNLSYLKSIYGEKGSPDYNAQTNFQVLWNHTQDSKANPNMSLSASVNFTTSGYSRNDLGSYYSNSFTENTKSSTVNMTYRFPQSKWSLSTTMNLSQRTQDSTLTVSFPNVTLTMSQIYPFKRKKAAGDEKWYEKIKMSYSGQFQNSLTSKQDLFFQKSLIRDWRNGFKHNIPISATFNLFKYINVTPQVNLTDRMYTSKVRKQWDEIRGIEQTDTNYGFYNVWDFNASVSFDTKVYGFFQPLPFWGDKVKMIRHVLTPTVSFTGAPDYSSPFFGYYGTYNRPGTEKPVTYSMFPNTLYGVPGQGRTGAISVSLANNLEMKVKTDNDSIGEKKISLIENLSLSQSYNMAADSLRFSDLNTSILLRLTKGFNLNLNATWDVYTYALNSSGNPVRINKLRIESGKGYGKLRTTGTSFSYTFNNDTFKNLFSKDKDKDNNKKQGKNKPDDSDDETASLTNDSPEVSEEKPKTPDEGYVKWEFPWSLSVNYSINYGYGEFDKAKLEYKSKITQNLSFSGTIRPTQNWNFSFSASYNFDTGKLAYMNCNISRDLHCFTMSASFVPVGPYKSYNFHIAVKSSLLSDFKYDKRSSIQNGITWY